MALHVHQKRTAVLVICILLSGIADPVMEIRAQETYELDLAGSIEIAKQKNHQMLILNQALAQAGYQLKAATSRLKTHIDMTMALPNYTETVNEFEDSTGITFYPVKQLRYNGGLIVSQPLPTDGQIYLRSGLENVLDYFKSESLTRMDLRVGFYQPLSAFYAYNNIRSEFKRAQLNYELSLRRLKRSELDLIYETSRTFYDLVAARERLHIAEQVLEVQKEAYEIAQQKYDAGLIREVEALQMEVDLGEANNDYDLARVALQSQMNFFKQELGLSLQDNVSIISDLSYETVVIDEEFAVDQGLKNRMELREQEIQIELSELEVKRARADRLVQGNITGYFDLIGTDQSAMPYVLNETLGSSWNQLRDRPGNFGVAFNVTIPIFDWGERKSLVRAAEAGLTTNRFRRDEQKIIIEREIRNTVNQLTSSLSRLRLLEKNVDLAEKGFAISRDRFSNGDIDSQALALDRTRLNAAYQSRLEAFISYKLLLADVMRKTFYDFENGVPIVVN